MQKQYLQENIQIIENKKTNNCVNVNVIHIHVHLTYTLSQKTNVYIYIICNDNEHWIWISPKIIIAFRYMGIDVCVGEESCVRLMSLFPKGQKQ